ncbi:MAG: ribonuclease E/G [Pseudomonadota bacterium]
MSNRLLVDQTSRYQRVALLDRHHQLQGLWVQPVPMPTLNAGAIVQAKPHQENTAQGTTILSAPGLGELQIKSRELSGATTPIMIQVTANACRSPHPGVPAKRARASSTLSWASRYMVYMPLAKRRVQHSKRAQHHDVAAVETLLAPFDGHWIIRARAQEVSLVQLGQTAQALYDRAQAVLSPSQSQSQPLSGSSSATDDDATTETGALVQAGVTALEAALIEMPPAPSLVEIFAEDDEAEAACHAALGHLGLAGCITQQAGLFEGLDVVQAVEALRLPVVTGAGFRLVIEPTEALTAIDVDLADQGRLDAALIACWHQIRLRHLSGMIMIDIPRQVDWSAVKKRLHGLTADHAEPVTVTMLPGPGMVSLSIPRRRPMLHEVLID